jgi:acetyl esterase/lipase
MHILFGLILGFFGGVLGAVVIRSIIMGKKIRNIEKRKLHWVLTDRIQRENTQIVMKDGTILHAYIYSSDITPTKAPAVLFLHGLGGFAQDFNFEPMLSAISLAGYRVFAYDFRASGSNWKKGEPTIIESLGGKFIDEIFEDPKNAFDWVYSHDGVNQEKIAVIGASLGGGMALSTLLHENRAKMVVGICAPHDFAENLEKTFIKWSFLNRMLFKILARKNKDIPGLLSSARMHSPSNAIDSSVDYTNRVFLAHTKTDKILKYEVNFPQNVEKMRLPPNQYIVFDRGGHEFKGVEPSLLSRIIYWLNIKLS